MSEPVWARWAWCGLDFVRAMNERPLWAKLLFRIVVGRYAYREFTLLVNSISRDGMGPFGEYNCEGAPYHDDPQPWVWWNESRYDHYVPTPAGDSETR